MANFCELHYHNKSKSNGRAVYLDIDSIAHINDKVESRMLVMKNGGYYFVKETIEEINEKSSRS